MAVPHSHDFFGGASDATLFCYFFREQDGYNGYTINMDFGDALLVIEYLIKKFNLSPEVIAAMKTE
ncbi:MAG TPA: hypothetical protein VNI84_13880 [Pyrinomonadaceae bacterium]|nr:hypothetical protein [Pyrinomonadaceae bacterium]